MASIYFFQSFNMCIFYAKLPNIIYNSIIKDNDFFFFKKWHYNFYFELGASFANHSSDRANLTPTVFESARGLRGSEGRVNSSFLLNNSVLLINRIG